MSTPFGQLLTIHPTDAEVTEGGQLIRKQVNVHCVNPAAVLWHVCRESPEFGKLMSTTCASSPSSFSNQWKICFYIDDVAPGNVLRHCNARKLTVAYWTLQNLGQGNLGCERLWFVAGLCKSDTVRTLVGKTGAFAKICLQFEPFNTGVVLQLPPREERHVLFASLSIFRNLVDVNSELHTFSASIVPSSCLYV